jgi:hypothetical protein
MATIVKYSTDHAARNNYPHKIISPPFPSRCYGGRMARMGALQGEDERKFYYRRCETCGFTVREFPLAFGIKGGESLVISASDPTWRWIQRIQREVNAEYAA